MMLLVVAVPVALANNGQDKVGICHATGSESNPYVFIVIATPADRNAHVIDENGTLHGDRLGNQDFYADKEEECYLQVSPTPSTSAAPTLEPTAAPSMTPTPSVEPTPQATPSDSPKPSATTPPTTPSTKKDSQKDTVVTMPDTAMMGR